jgi:DNA-binding CsgD family transcriptional regulator/tetratricopeptide (TPR) repeat protein
MGRLVVAEPGGGNLRRLGKFVGRRDELQRFRELIAAGTPLVTVSGLSGVGKTRFVREALGELVDSWFSAADVDDVSALVPAVEQRAGALLALSAPDHHLIVIDSMDDVVVGRAAIAALDRFPKLQIVVTSQSRMNVSGEVLFRLAPLSYPERGELVDPAEASRWDAVECFTAAAQRVDPEFRLTFDNIAGAGELVHAAGGLPLAIDLLANWLRVLSVEQLVQQVARSLEPFAGGAADLPTRQQDLRESIRASFHALSAADQGVLSALAHLGNVSADGLSEGIGRPISLDVLGRLIDRNLIAIDESANCLSMHPTVRRVVAELSDGTNVEQRFIEWVAGLVAAHAPLLSTDESKEAFKVFDDLQADIAAALDQLDRHPTDVAMLIADLSRYWYLTRQTRIYHHWCIRALGVISGPDQLRARLHLGASVAARFLFEGATAVSHANEALAAARRAQDDRLVVDILPKVISARTMSGNFVALSDAVAEAQAICEERHLYAELAELQVLESERLTNVGQLPEALMWAEKSVENALRGPNLYIQHETRTMLSYALMALDEFDLALAALDVAESGAEELDQRCGIAASCALYRGACLDEMGRTAEAAELLRRAVAEYQELELALNICQAARLLAETLSSAGHDAEARDMFVRSIELSRISASVFRTLVCLVAVAISEPSTRPDLELCDQILRAMELQSPGFLDVQTGVWKANLARLRADVRNHVEPSALESPLLDTDELVDRTLAQLRAPQARPRNVGLSAREAEVLRRVALGETDKEIADELHIGIRTVNSHVSNVLRKLGVERRRQAAAWARANLISAD